MNIKSKLKKLFVGLLIFFGFLMMLFSHTQKTAKAQELWGQGESVKTNIEQETGLSAKDPRLIIANVIKIFLGFLGLVTLILVLYAGFLWMTAGGDAEKIEQAKKILKNAIIGLLIILSSYAIVNFIFSKFLGKNNNVNSAGSVKMEANSYLGALGENIIESHYPARGQEGVPRNTKIIITFREEISPDSIMVNISDCGDEITCGDLNFGNIRIFPTEKHDSCEYNSGEYKNCAVNNSVNVKVQTKDKKMFFLKPQAPLGNKDSITDYTVYLSSGIKRSDQTAAFGNMGNYSWNFSVSTNLDLAPPKIESVFPFPDNYADNYNNIAPAVAAKWEIKIKNLPSGASNASAAISSEDDEIIGSSNVKLTGRYEGDKDGKMKVCISDDLKAVIYFAEEGQSFKELIARGIVENNIAVGYGLNLQSADGFETGNQWIINVQATKAGDYIYVNNIKYVFGVDIPFAGNDTTAILADKVAALIIKEQGDLFEAEAAGHAVSLTAKSAGESANGILISSSDSSAIEIKLISGVNRIITPQKRGGLFDAPINSIIQINFNEAIDPLTAGNYISVYTSKGKLDGEFLFSNQYKTVEFKPANSCGQNACGEIIYCLPEKERVLISIKAGELQACEENFDCADYPLCEQAGSIKVCKKQEGSVKFNNPAAKLGSGIVDMCDNSFDGNNNMNAEGPGNGNEIDQSGKSAYNENGISATCGAGDTREYEICSKDNNICAVKNDCKYLDGQSVISAAERVKDMQNIGGDDYSWHFYTSTSNEMVSGAPEIISRAPASGARGILKDEPLTSTFNRLMMSSTLKTGAVKFQDDNALHTRIMLQANSSSQIGYWIEKENLDAVPRDGYYDRTAVIIKHDKFEPENSYSGDIGSGVKDIYQNCYNPSVGPCAADPGKQCTNCGAGGKCDVEK